jgi:replication factor A1
LAGDTEVHAGDRSSVQIDPEDMPKSDLPKFGDLFTPLGELSPGAYQVNAVGIAQSEPKYYNFRKEDRTGSVLRTIVADESGTITLVAWNERAEELRELKNGDILQILNARVRLDNNARPELHVESRSQVQLLKSPPEYLKIPVAKSYKIADIDVKKSSVDLSVRVLAKGVIQEIKRATGETVKVSRLIVSDETGIVSLSLWDDRAELVNQIQEGEMIELKGASVRERLGGVMLSLGRSGELRKAPEKQVGAKPLTKLNTLQQSKGLVIVEGTVTDEPLARQVVTAGGESISLASFTLRDETASCRVTFWRDQATLALGLRSGARVRILGLRVRMGLGGEFELSSIPLSRIEVLEVTKERPAWEDVRHVIALEPGLNTWVKGVVLDIEDPKLIAICESCGSRLKVSNNNFRCESCKEQRYGNVAFAGRLRIDDGTGVANVVTSDIRLENLLPVNLVEIRAQILESQDSELAQSKDQYTTLVGKEIEVYGTAQASAEYGKYDLIAKKVVLADG